MKENDLVNLIAGITLANVPEASEVQAIAKGIDVKKELKYGEVEVIISNSAVDRHGEVIEVDGIDVSQVKRNPTVLWAHDYKSLPIGNIQRIWKSNGNLMGKISLDTDIDPNADMIYKKILKGTINAVSIGGMVKEVDQNDFARIKKLEMVEVSFVPVGAHPDALVTGKGFSVQEAISVFKNVITTLEKSQIHSTEPSEVEKKSKTILLTV